jgi:hypothetical protein
MYTPALAIPHVSHDGDIQIIFGYTGVCVCVCVCVCVYNAVNKSLLTGNYLAANN